MTPSTIKSRLTPLLIAAVWLAAWQLCAAAVQSELLLPGPLLVLRRALALLCSPQALLSMGATLSRIAAGYALGVVCAAGLAALAAALPFARRLLAPFFSLVKATPVASFTILALVWMTSARLSAFIAFLMALPIVYENTYTGLLNVDPRLMEMARVFRLPRARAALRITLPSVRPYWLSALRSSLGMAWKAGIAAEVIGLPSRSIGFALYSAKVYLEIPDLFAWTLIVVLLSALMERAVLLLSARGERKASS